MPWKEKIIEPKGVLAMLFLERELTLTYILRLMIFNRGLRIRSRTNIGRLKHTAILSHAEACTIWEVLL